MVDVKITYETLFDLLRREKAKEAIQALEPTFYADVLAYLEGRKAYLDDPAHGSDAAKEKFRIQFNNMKKILRELHDRREEKIVRLALNAARTGAGAVTDEHLLPNEAVLFKDLLQVLTLHRRAHLNAILSLQPPLTTYATSKTSEDAVRAEKSPELLSQPNPQQKEEGAATPHQAQEKSVSKEDAADAQASTLPAGAITAKTAAPNERPAPPPKQDRPADPVTLVFLKDVPQFIDKALAVHGPFKQGDEQSLPGDVAMVLLRKGLAKAKD
ncbi:DNA replication complex GINS family protein [Candidatus Woesearchaeota archaeon]|nr:MAG: DNA replication complex GINS family protein [Candidatus Woesearchaeota archaeon]